MNDDTTGKTRRTFLAAVAGTGAAVGTGNVVATTGDRRRQVATSYRLGGRVAGWQGREPESISGTVNPTLNLEAGTAYEFTWQNLDGAAHNVAILSEGGEVLARTEIISEQGATQTLQFTATGEMSTYLCQVHPNSMQGNVVIGAAAQGTTPSPETTAANQTTLANATRVGAQQTETTAANRTETETTTVPNPTAAPVTETTHPLADQYGQNPVKLTARLEPVEGVETDASGRVWFVLHPPNGSRPTLLYAIHLENAEDVTGAAVHLANPGEPVVAWLYRPEHPVDVIDGTLADAQLTPDDLTGPFQGAPLLRLLEAVRNDNAVVMVRTQDRPDGLLRGRVRVVEEAGAGATVARTTGAETTAPGTETVAGTPTATGQTPTDEETAAGAVDAAEAVRQAPVPGFGSLTALGGLGGLAGYLLSGGDGDGE